MQMNELYLYLHTLFVDIAWFKDTFGGIEVHLLRALILEISTSGTTFKIISLNYELEK